MLFTTHYNSPALWQTYLSDPASILMEGTSIFNKNLLFLLTMVVVFFCLPFTSIIFDIFKLLFINKFKFFYNWLDDQPIFITGVTRQGSVGLPNHLLSETQPVEAVPPAEAGDTGNNQPDNQEPPVSSTIATGVLVSNLRRLYKGAQDSIVGILAFNEFTDPAVVQAEVDNLKDLLEKADEAGCNLQWHLDPEGYGDSSDQRLYNAMDANLVNIDDADLHLREGDIQPLDDFRE